MSLRTKLVVALVGCAALAAAAVGVLSYRATDQRLGAEVDASLEQAAQAVLRRVGTPGPQGRPRPLALPDSPAASGAVSLQLIGPDGGVVAGPAGATAPVDAGDMEVATAAAVGVQRFRTVDVDGDPVRVLTVSAGGGRGAVQASRSLAETEAVLGSLQRRILLVTLVVVGVAAVAGWAIARSVTRRLLRLTDAAEEVTSTGRLDLAVPVGGTDEPGRLGIAFNEMLAALARSRDDQRRLVQDAGHELRTPMTSLRTNLYTLRRTDDLGADERDRVLSDLESEADELSLLIDEVVEVATDRRGEEPVTDVDLVALARRVAERAGTRWSRPVEVHAEAPAVVAGRPEALRRAVGNVVDNACKFDTSGGAVELWVHHQPGPDDMPGATVRVLDRGPGIAEGDLPHVFDRFYRADTARARPGSGLGLSIVAEVVGEHGGAVRALPRDGGGCEVALWLPLEGPGPAG